MLKKSGSLARSTWLEWSLLLIGLGLICITEAFRVYTLIGLALLIVAFALRAIRDGRWWLHTGMEIPGLVFLASAVLAAWISYDRGAAFLQCERFIAVGILFYAVAGRKIHKNEENSAFKEEAELRWVAAGILVLASVLALYWPLHQEYSAAVDKFFLITNLLGWIKAHLPAISGPTFQSNVAAGALILAVPLGLGLVVDAWRRRATVETLLAFIGTAIVLIGLLLTSSRGAWIGLIAATSLATLIFLQRRWISTTAKWGAFWVTAVLGGLVIIEVLILSGKADRLVGPLPDPTGSLQSRITVWSDGPDLIGDYIFTGSGLMTMSRVFSVYELLIPVPYQGNLNNLFLQIWLEQGILGEIALLGILGVVAGWAWKALIEAKNPLSNSQSILGWAGLVSVTAITLHNFVEVVFYGDRTLPLVGLVLGYAYFASPVIDTAVPRRLLHPRVFILGAIVVGFFALMCILFYRPVVSAFFANLGAIEQTRLEMSNYNPDYFQKESLDQVRRRLSLDGVENLLYKSLVWNPRNRVALLRLGDIALSYNDELSAEKALQAAWDAGYRDNRTRLLFGDLLVMQGKIETAASVQKGVAWAEWRMSGEAWYRYWQNNDYRRALDAWQTVLLLNPSNQDARYWSEQAIQRLNEKNQ
jgi:tetratricopeptide (TPR) repeat protein